MTTYQSTEEYLRREKLRFAADTKADTDPGSVTDDDLKYMSDEKLSAFLRSGAAAHLDIGGRGTKGQR